MENQQRINIYFLGSGAIGIPALDTLMLARDIELTGVASQPDKPAGRRREPAATPLANFAQQRGLDVAKPETVNSSAFLDELRNLKPDIIVVVAFGQILKQEILELPPYGCLNVHASLLPKHRGASPITSTILAGDSYSGITFMRMAAGVDTGPVYDQFQTKLTNEETTGELETRLGYLAGGHITDCVRGIHRGKLKPQPQDEAAASCTEKLKKKDAEIDWSESAHLIERKIRAFYPHPKAFTRVLSGKKSVRLQITNACVRHSQPNGAEEPATILKADNQELLVQCGQGILEILQVVPEGKREMDAVEFLRGTSLQPGSKLGEEGAQT